MINCCICKEKHDLKKLFDCDNDLTNVLYKYNNTLNYMIEIKNLKKKYEYLFECEICGKSMRSVTTYKYHKNNKVCIKAKNFRCNLCNKIFSDRKGYKYHIKNSVCEKKVPTNIINNKNISNNISNTTNNTSNMTNNIANNNTANIQNQNIFNITLNGNADLKEVVELLPFRNVSYKIPPEKYLEYATNPEQAITKFVKDQHFNPNIPERMNIINTNRRDNRAQLYDFDDDFNCRWQTKNKETICELLYDRGVNTLFFAKDNLTRAGIKLDPKKEAKLKEKIKEYENNSKIKKKYVDMIADITYDYRDLVENNRKKICLTENNLLKN
jgi:hypothetical protein